MSVRYITKFQSSCLHVPMSILAATSILSFLSSGAFSGCQYNKPDEQTEKRPPAPCGCRGVFWWGPVPWPLSLLYPARGHLPPLQLLPWPWPLQGPICSTGESGNILTTGFDSKDVVLEIDEWYFPLPRMVLCCLSGSVPTVRHNMRPMSLRWH